MKLKKLLSNIFYLAWGVSGAVAIAMTFVDAFCTDQRPVVYSTDTRTWFAAFFAFFGLRILYEFVKAIHDIRKENEMARTMEKVYYTNK